MNELFTTIGEGDAEVRVEYSYSSDKDHNGVHFEITWDGVCVYFNDMDITATISADTWQRIENEIHEVLSA